MKQTKKKNKKEWVKPRLTVYGDMASLTRQNCSHGAPHCKPKVHGMGDDFSSNISSLGH